MKLPRPADLAAPARRAVSKFGFLTWIAYALLVVGFIAMILH